MKINLPFGSRKRSDSDQKVPPQPDNQNELPSTSESPPGQGVMNAAGPQQVLLPSPEQSEEKEESKKNKARADRDRLLIDEYEFRERERTRRTQGKARTFTERFIQAAVWTTDIPARKLAGRIPELREDIQRSNLNIAPEGIIALSIFITFLTIPFVVIGDFLLATAGFLIPAIFLPVVLILPFAFGLSLPKISASTRAAAIDPEIPWVVGYITVLAGGGISPFRTIKRLASADKIFPAAAKEARRILLDMELFGRDPITAFERASRYTPNRRFADFLGGYVAVLKTGGDIMSYLQSQLRDIYAYAEIKVKSSAETIGNFSETYIIATVVLGISLFIFFIAEALINSSGGLNPEMIELFAVAFVPGISIAFIMIVNSAQIKEPFTYYPPYFAFLGSIPVGAGIFALFYYGILPMQIPIYMALGISLAITTAPAAIVNEIHSKRKKSVEAKLSNFVRDIAEIRKTGLAPEKTVEQLADRQYGGLTLYVQRLSNELSWGIPIRRVLEIFMSKVRSWLTQAVAFLLLEVVDVGGGSPTLFMNLADFTEKIKQLDKERRSQVRMYIFIPYIGAITIVVTAALIVYLLSQTSVSAAQTGSTFISSPAIIQQATSLLLLASFFQAWFMGFVAGKMGELTVADGFKHATAIVLASMVTVIITSLFVHF